MTPDILFSEQDARQAADEWGANCGPAALAVALGLPLSAVKGLIPEFDVKGYTTPRMMRTALRHARARAVAAYLPSQSQSASAPQTVWDLACDPSTISLVRIQWAGPWTAEGATWKGAQRHTHWIAAWGDDRAIGAHAVFDVNGGAREAASWVRDVLPPLLASVEPKSTGSWHPTHIWRVHRHAA